MMLTKKAESHLITVLRHEMMKYSREGLNGVGYFTENMNHKVFAVVMMSNSKSAKRIEPFLGLFVRVIADSIVIDSDRNSKPLADALLQAGIPREEIILAYAGEKVPDVS